MRVKNAAGFDPQLQRYVGTHQVYRHPKFGFIVSKWPRKRGPKATAAQLEQRNAFTQSIIWARDPLSSDVTTAQEYTKNTGYLVRDVIQSAMFGLVVDCYTKDGKHWIGRRMAANNIQAQLDSIDDTVGSMLFRGPTGWVGLTPGVVGQVLEISPTTELPAWGAGGTAAEGPFQIGFVSTPIIIGSDPIYLSQKPLPTMVPGSRLSIQTLVKRPSAIVQGMGIFDASGNGYLAYWGPSNEISLWHLNAAGGSAQIGSQGNFAPTLINTGYIHQMEIRPSTGNNSLIVYGILDIKQSAVTTCANFNLTTGTWYAGVVDLSSLTNIIDAVVSPGAFN